MAARGIEIGVETLYYELRSVGQSHGDPARLAEASSWPVEIGKNELRAGHVLCERRQGTLDSLQAVFSKSRRNMETTTANAQLHNDLLHPLYRAHAVAHH
jgi:hypothetical protein